MSKNDFFNLLFWIKNIYPIVFFSGFVYTLVLFLNLCGVYQLKKDNPIIIMGYLSLIHFFSYPLFQLGINGHSICLLIFPYINLIWIVAVVIGNFVIYYFITDSKIQLSKTPFHYHFITAYFIFSVILEILLMVFKTQEMKKVQLVLETEDSQDYINKKIVDKNLETVNIKTKIPKEDFQTIIITQNEPISNDKDDLKEITLKKISLPTFVIEKNAYNNYKSNKEQATNLIETQNSIRNILLNKKKTGNN